MTNELTPQIKSIVEYYYRFVGKLEREKVITREERIRRVTEMLSLFPDYESQIEDWLTTERYNKPRRVDVFLTGL